MGKIASPASGNEKYAQARFSAKRANGLAKPSNGLASRSAGLGLGSTPKSKPKPEKARLRWCKPVLQAENVTLLQALRQRQLFTTLPIIPQNHFTGQIYANLYWPSLERVMEEQLPSPECYWPTDIVQPESELDPPVEEDMLEKDGATLLGLDDEGEVATEHGGEYFEQEEFPGSPDHVDDIRLQNRTDCGNSESGH
ncbi:hypothetical protein B0H13DRAFT_1909740 [Mycena leptocephala]|nr:hypothetical protein B0H13DRAFT_1909740 [Mycena leptocephala]